MLFAALGKPVFTSRFYSGVTNKHYVSYQYYVLCLDGGPEGEFYMGSYIEFVFDETEGTFLEILDGDFCG